MSSRKGPRRAQGGLEVVILGFLRGGFFGMPVEGDSYLPGEWKKMLQCLLFRATCLFQAHPSGEKQPYDLFRDWSLRRLASFRLGGLGLCLLCYARGGFWKEQLQEFGIGKLHSAHYCCSSFPGDLLARLKYKNAGPARLSNDSKCSISTRLNFSLLQRL